MMPNAIPADALGALRAGLGHALGSPVESIEVTATRERIYSTIRFCSVELRDRTSRDVVVKTYKPWKNSDVAAQRGLLLRDYEINTYLHGLLAGQARFRVPTPLYHSPEHLLIATEHMAGTQLQTKLRALARWLPSEATVRELEHDCRGCGEWLRHFQRLTRARATGNADVQRMRQLIADRLEWSADAPHIPIDAAQRELILAYFDSIARDLSPEDLASSGIHGDFFPGNVVVSAQQIVGLDFVMQREGSVHADPSYFVFQLNTLGQQLQYRRAVVRRLCAAFLDGYEPGLREATFASRPMVRLYFIFHQAMRLGRMLVLKDAPVLRRLNNRRMAAHAVSTLCDLALQRRATP
jgi:hypothetical protein